KADKPDDKKPDDKKPDTARSKAENAADDFAYQPPRQPTPRRSESAGSGKSERDEDKPDLVLWHWKDDRLQSQQQVQEQADKNYSYLCLYRVKEGMFLRLADDSLRTVAPAPKQRWAVGYDSKPYDLSASLDGRRYTDVYVIDLHTGQRRLAFSKHRGL